VASARTPSAPDAGTSPASPGRPRRYEADEEIELIFTAALEVMRRNDFQDLTIADILDAAGMSTRSFYRHFQSKDELLCALYRRDADRATAMLVARLRDATSPRQALETWIDEILGIGHDRARARRAAILRSAGARRAEGSAAEAQRAVQQLTAPLMAILEAGKADGSFPRAEPESDARMISAATWSAAGLATPTEPRRARADALDEVLHFSLRALGA
jgi:AcrR family transcriptional regulator